MSIETILYRAHANATGGRDGRAATDDGRLDVRLATPASWAAPAAKAPTPSSCSQPATAPASWAR